MNIKDLKIGTRLKLGFAALLLLVMVLGAVANIQTGQLHQQTQTLYDHPLQVRRAIGELKADILFIHRDMKNLFLTADEKDVVLGLNQIETFKINAFSQIDILYSRYLGPRQDIDTVKQEFMLWNLMRDETIRLMRAGKTREAAVRTTSSGEAGEQVEILLKSIGTLDVFSVKKADDLYAVSLALHKALDRQLLFLVAAIVVLSLFIGYILLRAVQDPIDELIHAARRFQEGDRHARSSNTSKNEFGLLSASFNAMVADIQVKTDLDEKFAGLAALMLSEYDIKKFFQATLTALAAHTGSQTATIYLLSDDKKTLGYFESMGAGDTARQSFDADRFEGEFGAVLSTRRVQHIKSIPEDTRFIFHTVSGGFIPREIITLPILADNQVVAVISLSSVSAYSQSAIQLIDRILVTLSARVEGILAYHKMKAFTETLERQNRELEAQKTEMALQSAELTEQNSELEMQKNQLDEASRLKTQFLSNMSHELRTPLNSVIALSGVLNRRLARQIPEEEYSYLEVIERNGKHLLNLINDILDIARIESGHEAIEITKFDANSLIADVVGMIRPQAEQKNIELLHTGKASRLPIASDADKCRHILQNLVANAVKFTEKGKVDIVALQTDRHLTISVTDTGVGIAQNHIDHIFDEFRQADGSTSRKFGGTGLGLAIAKKYATLLGGTITVNSTPGKGSEFMLTLPNSPSSVKTILLVEDSEPAIIQIKDFLEESGYEILVARDGGEALGIIAKTLPDAMILDLMMPGIDGFEVLKTLREAEATAHIPVLILTAKHITREELQFLKRNNVHQLIQKGDVNRKELLNAIATMRILKKPENR